MPKAHKNLFHTMTEEEFYDAVRKLDAQIPGLERNEVIVELARIVAMVRDGHTLAMGRERHSRFKARQFLEIPT